MLHLTGLQDDVCRGHDESMLIFSAESGGLNDGQEAAAPVTVGRRVVAAIAIVTTPPKRI
jgi:hypothetical protein